MDIHDIREAAQRIAGHVKNTPLERSETLSKHLDTNIYVKYELFQKTGSFKARGTFNKLLSMSDDQRSRGVAAVSGGNHAQAVAYVSRELGVDAVICMAENTPSNYVNATRDYGAAVDLQPSIAAAFERVKEYESLGRNLLHPFDDEMIVAGQGTVGLEIMDDAPQITDVIVSIGGGGLAGGVAAAVKSIKPDVRVWGVETVGADAMSQALAVGHPVETVVTSIAKTLGAPYVTDLTLKLAQKYFEGVTVVTDAEAVESLVFIAERLKVLTEPAASCTLAAAEKLRANFTPDSHVVLIFCGGNVSIADVCGYIQVAEARGQARA